ncbi:MAG: PQQ-binding-like beta-propeller repeat protein [Tepidisphaerales bacterium]
MNKLRISESVGVWAVAALALIGWAGWGQAADWAQWRGPNRDGHVPAGEKVPATLPAEIKPRWRIPIGEGYSSPVVAGGTSAARVFYSDLQGGKEVMHAVEAATGKEVWQSPLDSVFKDDWGQGPRCTPVVDGPLVFAQSCRGELQCLSAAEGKLLWRKNYVQDFGAIFMGETGPAAGATRHGNTGSPVVDGDHLIAQAGGLKGAGLVCFNKAGGEVVWKSQNDTAGNAAPVIATLGGVRQVISFTALGLIGVDAGDGTLLWRVPLNTRLGRHVTTPVVVDNLVIVGSYQLGLTAVKISRDGGNFKAEPAWTSRELAANFASPVAVGGHVYGVGLRKNVYCVEARTGKVAWSQTGLLGAGGDRAFATFMVMGGKILMLTDAGELILFAASPAGFEPAGRVQACGATWCSPAYADGVLYLRDAKSLLCVDVAP